MIPGLQNTEEERGDDGINIFKSVRDSERARSRTEETHVFTKKMS